MKEYNVAGFVFSFRRSRMNVKIEHDGVPVKYLTSQYVGADVLAKATSMNVILYCADCRLYMRVPELLRDGLGITDAYGDAFAGGAPAIALDNDCCDHFHNDANLFEANGVRTAYLIGHDDCAFCKARGFTTPREIMNLTIQAAKKVKDKYPNMEVISLHIAFGDERKRMHLLRLDAE